MVDKFLKNPKSSLSVIPVKTGIQCFYMLVRCLDSRLRGNDGFFRVLHG